MKQFRVGRPTLTAAPDFPIEEIRSYEAARAACAHKGDGIHFEVQDGHWECWECGLRFFPSTDFAELRHETSLLRRWASTQTQMIGELAQGNPETIGRFREPLAKLRRMFNDARLKPPV